MQKRRSLILIRRLDRYRSERRDLVRGRDSRSIDLNVGEVVVPVVPGDCEGVVGVWEQCLGVCWGGGDGRWWRRRDDCGCYGLCAVGAGLRWHGVAYVIGAADCSWWDACKETFIGKVSTTIVLRASWGYLPGQAGIHPAVGQVCLPSRRDDLFAKLTPFLGRDVAKAIARKKASEAKYRMRAISWFGSEASERRGY